MDNFSKKELKQLQKLNKKFQKLQMEIISEAVKIDKKLSKKKNNLNDILYDYELEVIVSCFLKENDLHFQKDKDNILAEFTEYIKNISSNKRIEYYDKSINHNEFYHWKGHPMKGEYHCWWFHWLYDHIDGIKMKDLLRVCNIFVDINVSYQYKGNRFKID